MNSTPSITRKGRRHFDWPLLIITFALAAFGVYAVTFATYKYSADTQVVGGFLGRITSSYYGGRQALFLLVSPIVIIAMMAIPYRLFYTFSGVLYVAGLGLMGMVKIFGSTTSGVTSWFDLFSGYMLQPSEFAKIAVILQLAKFFSRKDNPVTTLRDWVGMGLIMGPPIVLIYIQGELGTAIVFIAFYAGMMVVGGMRARDLTIIAVAAIVAMVALYMVMLETGSYRVDRIISFIDPSQADPNSIYQQNNSKIAIGSGGVYGAGAFTNGTYTALDYVPQDHTDFIFAAVGETLGFVGAMTAIVLYALMVYRMISLARHTADKFGRLVIVGVAVMMFFHIFYNISMTVGLMPVMGIPLPFLSYGGSNLVANMAGVALVLNITYRKPQGRVLGGREDAPVLVGGYQGAQKRRRVPPLPQAEKHS